MKNIILIFIGACLNMAVAAGSINGAISEPGPDNTVIAECKVECLFGSCTCKSGGTGSGCICACAWGWPVCGAGAGGKSYAKDYQLVNMAELIKLVSSFESEPAKQLAQDLESYVVLLKDQEDTFEQVERIKGNLESLRQEEKDQVNEFLLSKGETDLIK